MSVRIAPTAICNYRCLFCEIHKDNILYPKRSKNEITLEHIRNYEGVLEEAYNLSFYGGSEEPLVAKEFGQIVAHMKKKFGTKLMVNTNASLMKGDVLDSMVEHGFDYIIVSYHAGTTDGYRAIMTGKIEKVDTNLAALRDLKAARGKRKPVVAFNFALQRLNADEYEAILEKAVNLGADHVIVNRYYGGRNKLQDQNVSYEYDIAAGNAVLDDIYSKARDMGMKLEPAKPDYWRQPAESVHWDDENIDTTIQCHLPWSHLHFNPVLDRANSHFVGVCNRAELFKVDYARLNISTAEKADKIWNHSLLKHLRETVNKGCDSINPLCKFCKNNQREALRNVDAALYAAKRDQAVEAFFQQYNSKITPEIIEGLEVLVDNPHSEEKFQEKLGELNTLEIAEKRQLDEALDETALARMG
ncbi:MAG: radical SAM protein [Alphaproteobacteria bacterium]|nr:radical SAM protein [Alphaproteobacteria bacterium]